MYFCSSAFIALRGFYYCIFEFFYVNSLSYFFKLLCVFKWWNLNVFWEMINVIVSEAGKSSFTLWRILDILNRHHTKETINIKIFLFNKPIKRINVAFSIVWGNCHVLWYIQLLRESRGLFELPCSGGAHNYSQTLRKILYCRIVEENWNIFNLSSPRLLFRRRRRLEVSQTKHQKSCYSIQPTLTPIIQSAKESWTIQSKIDLNQNIKRSTATNPRGEIPIN